MELKKPAIGGLFRDYKKEIFSSFTDWLAGDAVLIAPLSYIFPANREFYREFRNYSATRDDMSSRKPLCCNHFLSNSLLNPSGKIVRQTGKGKPKQGMHWALDASLSRAVLRGSDLRSAAV